MEPEDEQGRIRRLASMARALAPTRPLPELLETAAEEARGALRAANVSISRRRPGSLEDPDIVAAERDRLPQLDRGSSLSAPIIVDTQLWGEVHAIRHRCQRSFVSVDVAYLDALVAILAGAISRAAREETLTELAFQDPLTGLMNRRALDEAATAAFTVPPGQQREVSVVVIDINGLKQVNDSQGHEAGDRSIQGVASTLLRGFESVPESMVARVGGDEFTVLATGQPPTEIVAVMDSISLGHRSDASASELSCGAASIVVTEHSARPPSELFAAADRAQYVAKRQGLAGTVVSEVR